MRKLVTIALSLLSSVILSSLTNVFAAELSNLRNAAIPEEALRKLSERLTPVRGEGETNCAGAIGSAERYVYLTRPSEKNVVAALMINPNWKAAILNPKWVDYGEIPPLACTTVQQADLLWGLDEQQSNHGQSRTYRLTSTNNQDFYIDIVFNKNQIERYRVRSELLKGADWQLVEKKGEKI